VRRAATILFLRGAASREIGGDCLQLSLAIDARSLRADNGIAFVRCVTLGACPNPPASWAIPAFGTIGHLSSVELIDRTRNYLSPSSRPSPRYPQERLYLPRTSPMLETAHAGVPTSDESGDLWVRSALPPPVALLLPSSVLACWPSASRPAKLLRLGRARDLLWPKMQLSGRIRALLSGESCTSWPERVGSSRQECQVKIQRGEM
jgi:hypothetical protein